jgi:hypothetical protein
MTTEPARETDDVQVPLLCFSSIILALPADDDSRVTGHCVLHSGLELFFGADDGGPRCCRYRSMEQITFSDQAVCQSYR